MTRSRAVGLAGLVLLVVLAVAAAARSPLPFPVVLDLHPLGPGAGRFAPLPTVEGRVALLVPLAAAAVGLLVRRRPGRTALLVVDGAASPIAVFLVAQANGMRDAAPLVLVYAATAATQPVRGLQLRDRGGRPAELPLWTAAALGVVPWGVIALQQVGLLLNGLPVAPGVQVLTLVVLAATVAEFVVAWRGRRRSPVPSLAEAVLVAVPPGLLALLGLLLLP